jgi:hypothetical protein
MFAQKASKYLLLIALLAIPFLAEPRHLQFWKIWKFSRPYTGPEMVVEIIGADLNKRANRFFDSWSQPDIFVRVHHDNVDRETQIEGNTYQPRFLWKTKIPHKKKFGLHFHVMEANVFERDQVMGRAFIDVEKLEEMLETGKPNLMSVGNNIGTLKIRLTYPPSNLKELGTFTSSRKSLEKVLAEDTAKEEILAKDPSGKNAIEAKAKKVGNAGGNKTKP